ncbi:LysE family translocator [Pontibacterium granulatum]|uniref:LysE family translocator n=1 Tax=Pontibacterium granulatum TaxID=2036029 RepID=UPI00249C07B1|nr:LysE family translocator [Pontibacterium granulatum]MDI3326517.1 LysE family translocator [Pontibacterium granulatum]
MTLATWLSIVAICILGALTPGPSLAVVLRHTVTNSRQHGIAAAICHAAGVALWALLTVMGLAILIAQSPILFKVITWGGAGYLAWLGYKALTAKGDSVLNVGETEHVSRWKAGLDGLMISLLNPKLALFFIALFSQFVSAEQTLSDQLIMMMTAGGIDGLWYLLVALVFSHSKVLTYLQKHTRWIDRITGGILIGLSARVVTLS